MCLKATHVNDIGSQKNLFAFAFFPTSTEEIFHLISKNCVMRRTLEQDVSPNKQQVKTKDAARTV